MDPRAEICSHENATQRIPWLINGTLDAEEAASVRAHLAVCTACRADFESEQRLYEAVRAEGPLIFSGEPSFQKLMARIEADEFAASQVTPLSTGTASIAAVSSTGPASVPAASRSGATGETATGDLERPAGWTPARRHGVRALWRSGAAVRWLAAAAVIEAVGLGLGAWRWSAHNAGDASGYVLTLPTSRSESAPYRTLTTPSQSYTSGLRVRVVFRPRVSLDQLRKLLRGIDAHIIDGPTDANVYTLGFAQSVVSTTALDERIATLRADPDVLFAEPAEVRPP